MQTPLQLWEARRLSIRVQPLRSMLLLGVVAATYLLVAALSRNHSILAWLEYQELANWKRVDGLYSYHTGYIDAGDRLLLEEIPSADYSHGGVYFIGSSTTLHSIMPWELPRVERAYVKNYAVQSANYKEQFQWVRYLVEQEHWLGAGPGRNLVVLGLAYMDARLKLPGTRDWDYVPELFKRHGLYQYDLEAGIRRLPLSAIERAWKLQQMRSYDFLKSMWTDLTKARDTRPRRQAAAEEEAKEIDQTLAFMENMFGREQWRYAIDSQSEYLGQMIDYLKAHGAKVTAVLLPLETWTNRQPYAEAFRQRVERICSARGVPLFDLSREVPDSEFFDKSHLSYRGQAHIQPFLAAIARKSLVETGVVP